MPKNRLNIISANETRTDYFSHPSKMKELQAQLERQWLTHAEAFNPLRNCMERERLERTWSLIAHHLDVKGKSVADIGCGSGVFSRRLRDAGAHVTGVDTAENALKKFQESDSKGITLIHGAVPNIPLRDQAYRLVVCTEVIGYLPKEDYRLFFAELARLLPAEGFLVCSTSIDIDTDGGVQRLVELAQTEFDIIEDCSSYHAFYLKCKRALATPSSMIRCWENPESRRQALSSRTGIKRAWYRLNTSPALIWLWFAVEPLTRPFLKILRNNTRALTALEKMCRFLWSDRGISHYLFMAKKRPLKAVDPQEIPMEHPKRKEIWE